jgi:peptidoglycan-associated lipoprotein
MRTIAIPLLVAVVIGGCATHGFVRQESEATEQRLGQRIEEIASQVEQTQDDVGALEERTGSNERQVAELSKTAREALDRAIAAGHLAEGKFLYETVLTDDRVRFGVDSAELSDEAKAALDAFAEDAKANNQDVYIEIQGHTDSTGSEAYNQKLGLERAEATRRYLSHHHGFALHRMSVISYGESEPMVDNDSRENRSLNRRVVLVVLR